jgi:heme oxygenase
MNDLLQELRSATSDIHRELDQIVPDPSVGPAAYGDYLSRFHQGVAAAWPMLDWNCLGKQALPEATLRKQRYRSLGRDLDLLGIPHEYLLDCAGAETATFTGCLYVLEGSIHGGQILLEKLAGRMDIPDEALSFLKGFGGDNRQMWSSFKKWLTELETTPEFIVQAREAAARTFSLFIKSFGQN